MIDFDLAKMYNQDNLTLVQIAEKVGLSKSTVQRRLTSDGWRFNKETGKYVYTVDYLSSSVQSTVQNEVSQEKVQPTGKIEIVNRTYGIPVDIDRALKIKCAIEGKNATDIVREALRGVIEEKYYNYK